MMKLAVSIRLSWLKLLLYQTVSELNWKISLSLSSPQTKVFKSRTIFNFCFIRDFVRENLYLDCERQFKKKKNSSENRNFSKKFVVISSKKFNIINEA
jgi:hypothetical protein